MKKGSLLFDTQCAISLDGGRSIESAIPRANDTAKAE